MKTIEATIFSVKTSRGAHHKFHKLAEEGKIIWPVRIADDRLGVSYDGELFAATDENLPDQSKSVTYHYKTKVIIK